MQDLVFITEYNQALKEHFDCHGVNSVDSNEWLLEEMGRDE